MLYILVLSPLSGGAWKLRDFPPASLWCLQSSIGSALQHVPISIKTHQRAPSSDLRSSLSLFYRFSGFGFPKAHSLFTQLRNPKFHLGFLLLKWHGDSLQEVSWASEGPTSFVSFFHSSLFCIAWMFKHRKINPSFFVVFTVLLWTKTEFHISQFCVIVKFYQILIKEDSCIIASMLRNNYNYWKILVLNAQLLHFL